MRMNRFVVFLLFLLSVLAVSLPSIAQTTGAIQLRLTNATGDKVDYYLVQPGGKPTFAGSVEPGAAVDVETAAGRSYVFAINRVPFQKYTTRSEIYQGLTLSPQGQQKPPVVANARQKPVSGATSVKTAPVEGGDGGTAPSGDGLVWTFSQFVDGNGVATAALSFGVPETDNIQFTALCSSAAPTPRVILSADVSRLRNGAAASVRFLTAGFNTTVQGKVRLGDGGESQDGLEMSIGADDPLWQAFRGVSAMNYSVQGQPPQRMSLTGVQEPLANFLEDCGQIGSAGGGNSVVSDATQLFAEGTGAGSANTTAGAAADSCAALDGVVSKNGGKNVSVEFVNRTDEYRVVLWIDFDGMPVEYAQLQTGESFQVETSSTHPWMATDGPGNCIEKFMPKDGQAQILISRKSPGFGDE